MRIKVIALLAIFAAALCMTGCDKGRAQMGPREAHLLGAAKLQKANYTSTGPTTIAISTDELYERQNFSGNKTTILWGLVTLKDY